MIKKELLATVCFSFKEKAELRDVSSLLASILLPS